MAGNTFAKRQKERARQDKQKAKAERRLQRKQEKTGLSSLDEQIATPEEVAALFNHPESDSTDTETEDPAS
jgi:hypothetical protein